MQSSPRAACLGGLVVSVPDAQRSRAWNSRSLFINPRIFLQTSTSNLTRAIFFGSRQHWAQLWAMCLVSITAEEQLQRIIEAAEGQYRILFAVLAGTGMRIGEASGLHVDDLDLDNCVVHVRRGVWNGRELSPKTKNTIREIDIDPGLAALLKQHVGDKKAGRVFEARNGSPISGNNVLKRGLHPLLKRLGIQKAGLHAFRHSRVTMLRKRGTPEDLQKQWIGHSSLRTTDRYSHTDQELEYRRVAASKAGLSFTVGPNDPKRRSEI